MNRTPGMLKSMVHKGRLARGRIASALQILALLLVAPSAFALQVLDTSQDGVTLHGRISRDEMTRLTVQDGRIVSMHYPDGRLTVEKDDDQGYAVLRARDDKPVSLIVTTSSGQTHSLYLTPDAAGMETIILKEKPTQAGLVHTNSGDSVHTEPGMLSIKRLMLAMARAEKDLRDFAIEPVNRDVSLWQEANFRMLDKYSGPDMTGYRFELINISGKTMRLGEQEFYKTGVIAVAIDRHILAPGEKTYVFVITERHDG